jgi:hypothetical protein
METKENENIEIEIEGPKELETAKGKVSIFEKINEDKKTNYNNDPIVAAKFNISVRVTKEQKEAYLEQFADWKCNFLKFGYSDVFLRNETLKRSTILGRVTFKTPITWDFKYDFSNKVKHGKYTLAQVTSDLEKFDGILTSSLVDLIGELKLVGPKIEGTPLHKVVYLNISKSYDDSFHINLQWADANNTDHTENIDCEDCNGTGYQKHGSADEHRCITCKGEGVVPKTTVDTVGSYNNFIKYWESLDQEVKIGLCVKRKEDVEETRYVRTGGTRVSDWNCSR